MNGELRVLSAKVYRERIPAAIHKGVFYFAHGQHIIPLEIENLKHLIADADPKDQQELYEYLHRLGCRIYR